VSGYSGAEPFTAREIDTEITKDSFVKKVSKSYDGGKTWQETDFVMIYKRHEQIAVKGRSLDEELGKLYFEIETIRG